MIPTKHDRASRVEQHTTDRAQIEALGDTPSARFEAKRDRWLRASGMGTQWPSAADHWADG